MNKAQHKHFAMTAAKRVALCRGAEREKARRDCVDHLRASLVAVAAAPISQQ